MTQHGIPRRHARCHAPGRVRAAPCENSPEKCRSCGTGGAAQRQQRRACSCCAGLARVNEAARRTRQFAPRLAESKGDARWAPCCQGSPAPAWEYSAPSLDSAASQDLHCGLRHPAGGSQAPPCAATPPFPPAAAAATPAPGRLRAPVWREAGRICVARSHLMSVSLRVPAASPVWCGPTAERPSHPGSRRGGGAPRAEPAQ